MSASNRPLALSGGSCLQWPARLTWVIHPGTRIGWLPPFGVRETEVVGRDRPSSRHAGLPVRWRCGAGCLPLLTGQRGEAPSALRSGGF